MFFVKDAIENIETIIMKIEIDTQICSIARPAAREKALAFLRDHQVIAAPTDTVYGVMCRYDSAQAIDRLYAAKDRPPQKAIPVLIGDLEQLRLLVPDPLSPAAELLIHRFWPGPLTIVFPALAHLPANLTAGQATVAVRMPDHAMLRTLIRDGGPVAATSANLSGQPEAHTAREVLEQLNGRIALVLEDEPQSEIIRREALPSTIIDITQPARDDLPILREGPLGTAVRKALVQLR